MGYPSFIGTLPIDDTQAIGPTDGGSSLLYYDWSVPGGAVRRLTLPGLEATGDVMAWPPGTGASAPGSEGFAVDDDRRIYSRNNLYGPDVETVGIWRITFPTGELELIEPPGAGVSGVNWWPTGWNPHDGDFWFREVDNPNGTGWVYRMDTTTLVMTPVVDLPGSSFTSGRFAFTPDGAVWTSTHRILGGVAEVLPWNDPIDGMLVDAAGSPIPVSGSSVMMYMSSESMWMECRSDLTLAPAAVQITGTGISEEVHGSTDGAVTIMYPTSTGFGEDIWHSVAAAIRRARYHVGRVVQTGGNPA